MNQQVCQSCAMPLTIQDQLGTNKDGSKNPEYCVYCFEQGEFKQPDLTMEQMVEVCVPFLKLQGMEEEKARSLMLASLPSLKRWKKVKNA